MCAGLMVSAAPCAAAPEAAPDSPGTDSADLDQARTLFDDAVELEAAQQWEPAIEKLREVLLIKETPGVVFHLAYCLEHTGQLVAALESYERCDELLAETPAPDVAQLVRPAIEQLEIRVPLLTVRLGVPHAELVIDGQPRPANQPVRLDPGPHQLLASAPGFIAIRGKVKLAEAERRSFSVDLDPLPPEPAGPEPLPAATDHRGWTRNDSALVVSGGFTLAAAAAGVTLTFVRARASHRAADGRAYLEAVGVPEADCGAPGTVDVERACWYVDVYGSDRDRARNWQAVGFAATGVGAAAVTTTWLLRRRAKGTAVRLPRIRLALGPEGDGGLYVAGQF